MELHEVTTEKAETAKRRYEEPLVTRHGSLSDVSAKKDGSKDGKDGKDKDYQ